MHHATPPYGGTANRQLTSAPSRYGRMFPHLAALELPVDLPTLLARAMIEENVDLGNIRSPSNNPRVPAGYTYLGQFIDHDLTFEPLSRVGRQNDPSTLTNFRTPSFDLDSIYGGGPTLSPHLYQEDGASLIIDESRRHPLEADLARNANGVAILPDPRNDENSVIAQLTLAIMRYHNRVVAEIAGRRATRGNAFTRAATMVRWHYQWIVLRDFLPRIVGAHVIDDVLRSNSYTVNTSGRAVTHTGSPWPAPSPFTWSADLRFYAAQETPVMPVEFSAAIYRFGHSMVRNAYALNKYSEAIPIPLFLDVPPSTPDIRDLRGGRRRPPQQRIEWRRFFNFSAEGTDYPELQPSRAIDTLLSSGLGTLPHITIGNSDPHLNSLAARNLLRGQGFGLPAGQDIARAMGLPESLILGSGTENIALRLRPGFSDPSVPDLTARGLSDDTIAELESALGVGAPLWYYVLKEAEVIGEGECLGPVGGRIVAEVFIGLMLHDGTSFLNVHPLWTPHSGEFGCDQHGYFSMRHLLAWVVERDGR